MSVNIAIADILKPIAGENPAGNDLRYDAIYDEIKEARKADDQLERGDWQRDLKSADWPKVVQLSSEALTQRTKDLQIAIWLTEGLIHVNGFSGLAIGLQVINGFLAEFWDSFYPQIDEGDLEYRIGPLEFLNDKLWLAIKQVSLSDKNKAPEYSWVHWQASRQVGYEKDTVDASGDVDEKKQARRTEAIAEGKLAPEEFDKAIALTSEDFMRKQVESLQTCREEFNRLDSLIDEKFGNEGPSLAELDKALTDCELFFKRTFKERGWNAVTSDSVEKSAEATEPKATAVETNSIPSDTDTPPPKSRPSPNLVTVSSPDNQEVAVWDAAITQLKENGIEESLALLFSASCSAQSVRQKNRYRLAMAKLCLKAKRVDLAKPILEELNSLITELQLVRWESPTWIGEVLEALYQCLTDTDERFHEPDRAAELLKQLCTTDVTKAMNYKN